LRLRAVVIVLRKNQVFQTADALVYRSYRGFTGFSVPSVPAYYRKDNPVDGYGVALILEPSAADQDFGVPIMFLGEDESLTIREAFDKSDDLTEKLLGRGWNGKRPYQKLHHFM
jgi:hypothetical protein